MKDLWSSIFFSWFSSVRACTHAHVYTHIQAYMHTYMPVCLCTYVHLKARSPAPVSSLRCHPLFLFFTFLRQISQLENLWIRLSLLVSEPWGSAHLLSPQWGSKFTPPCPEWPLRTELPLAEAASTLLTDLAKPSLTCFMRSMCCPLHYQGSSFSVNN